MSDDAFAALSRRLDAEGPEAVLAELADRLRDAKQYHELFDARLLAARRKLGLDPASPVSIDEIPEPLRATVEEAYLDACREVGALLLAAGRVREAWMYLRPADQRDTVARALQAIEPSEENLHELVEVALHEGVAPELGYRLVLEHFGTCNAITTFEGLMTGRPRADQQATAGLLIRQVHREVVNNVRYDIGRRAGNEPPEASLDELLAGRDELLADNNYHIDTTHLSSTVRFARVCEDRPTLELAWQLTEYGRRLGSQFQFAGEEPFVEFYRAHGLFFAAQLGRQVDEALQFFRERAGSVQIEEQGTMAAETYVALLVRLGRVDAALEAAADLLPPGTRTSGFAPSLLELSRRAGRFDRLLETTRAAGDLVGFATALVARKAGG